MSSSSRKPKPVVNHHINRRATGLIGLAPGKTDDDLLDTKALAAWLGLSTQFLEIGRTRGYGPRFIKISSRRVRYHRAEVIKWLKEREAAWTGELCTPSLCASAQEM